MIAMGYGGFWQHPDFHYDTGYAKGSRYKLTKVGMLLIRVDSIPSMQRLWTLVYKLMVHQRLEQLYAIPFTKNKHTVWYFRDYSTTSMVGVRAVVRVPLRDTHAHLHAAFGGADEGKL